MQKNCAKKQAAKSDTWKLKVLYVEVILQNLIQLPCECMAIFYILQHYKFFVSTSLHFAFQITFLQCLMIHY